MHVIFWYEISANYCGYFRPQILSQSKRIKYESLKIESNWFQSLSIERAFHWFWIGTNINRSTTKKETDSLWLKRMCVCVRIEWLHLCILNMYILSNHKIFRRFCWANEIRKHVHCDHLNNMSDLNKDAYSCFAVWTIHLSDLKLLVCLVGGVLVSRKPFYRK